MGNSNGGWSVRESQGIAHRVMIVEDDRLLAQAMKMILEGAGYEVVGPAASLGQAMDVTADGNFEAALLDVKLGKEISFPIADLLLARKIPFAFFTGQLKNDLPPRFVACKVLPKSCSHDDIMATIEALLSARAMA
jgi:DNA-binding response OmpR family regulator